MSAFSYTAIDARGIESRGEIQAGDVHAAREQLRAKGLLAQELKPLARAGAEGKLRKRAKVKSRSLQIFARQLATMVESGMSIVAALVVLERQTEDKVLAAAVRDIRSDVEAGLLLSQALARHPAIFNRLFVSMIEAGEAAGILDEVLDRLAHQIEKETALRRRVKSAMVYPCVIMVFALLVLTGMLLFLVPVFVGVFEDFGGELPTLTKMVLLASDLVRERWYIVFPAIAGAVVGARRWKRTEGGRRTWDRLKLRAPMKIGDIVLKIAVARFARTLSTLVGAGVDIIKALEITSQTAGNHVVETALAEVKSKVHEGVPIAQPLVANPIFPPMLSQMVKVGEESGELEKMLGKVADFYEDEVDTAIGSLTSIIEPLMMIGVGAVVGIIVISMYLPMFKMLTLIQ